MINTGRFLAVLLGLLVAGTAVAALSPEQRRERTLKPYVNQVTADWNARKTGSGIIVIGAADSIRAMSANGLGSTSGEEYAAIANDYKRTFGDKVNVYCMPIPTASAYYTPTAAQEWSRPQYRVINNIFAHLSDSVMAVDIYTTLGEHAAEPIYLRTDHHWAPKGAFYAARKFAQVARVPFMNLSYYEERIVADFVGTMYNYSKDVNVKRNPEDFVYYVPCDIDYTTTHYTYTLGGKNRVTATKGPEECEFFREYKDGSGAAYCTFMGGDTNTTHVHTATRNGRRLLILKDSFGNALPGYLFYSFEDIHVVDCRYFTMNLVKYVQENRITDILLANNLSHACMPATTKAYSRYLVQ